MGFPRGAGGTGPAWSRGTSIVRESELVKGWREEIWRGKEEGKEKVNSEFALLRPSPKLVTSSV